MEEFLTVKEYLEGRMDEDWTLFSQYLNPLENCYARYVENRLTETFVNICFGSMPYFFSEVRYMPDGVEEKMDNMYKLFIEKAKEQSNV